jgi:hypothetical protein
MMLKKGFFFVVVFISLNIFSQETTLDKVSQETCEYLDSDEMKNIDANKRNEKLGLFILNLYNKYEEELDKEGIAVDFYDGSDAGAKFGEKVGINMAKFCPEALIALAEGYNEEPSEELFEITGSLVNVVGNEFSTIILKDEEGKTQKFLWLQNFKGSDRLIQALENLNEEPDVTLIYNNIEFYSPQLKDYIIRKVIVELSFVE